MNSCCTNKIRIAIVDDHHLFSLTLSRCLQQQGFQIVLQAASGYELLEKIKECPIDIVITDYNMPYMNGLALLKRLQQLYAALPVIVISFNNDDMLYHKIKKAGAAAVLHKTADIQVYTKLIEQQLATGCQHFL